MLQIPGYDMLRELGQGVSGAVYLARDPKEGRLVAIKVLGRENQDNPTLLSRFKREIRASLQLEHDHLIRAHTAGIHDERWFYVMEYVEGQSVLDAIAERGRFDEQEAFAIALKVAQALAYAARVDLVHRDIKPENILLGADGSVKLCDMGLAKTVASDNPLTLDGTLVGTPQYMSPEQAGADGEVDARSDIYSLGATLYAMLAGRAPFEGKNPMRIIQQLLKGGATPLSELRPDLSSDGARLVERMMARQATDRPQGYDELLELLRPLAGAAAPAPAGDTGPGAYAPCAAPADEDLVAADVLRERGWASGPAIALALDAAELAALIGAPTRLVDALRDQGELGQAEAAACDAACHTARRDQARAAAVRLGEARGLVSPLAMARLLSRGDAGAAGAPAVERLLAEGLIDRATAARLGAHVRVELAREEEQVTGTQLLTRGWVARAAIDAAIARQAALADEGAFRYRLDLIVDEGALPRAAADAMRRAVRRQLAAGVPVDASLDQLGA